MRPAVKVSYLICGTQRTGSNVLCEALTLSGVAGHPTEHFVPPFPGSQALGHEYAGFERSAWARRRGIESFPAFFDAVVAATITPNGVFGTKLMWNALGGILERLAELPECAGLEPPGRLRAAFTESRFIYLRRRNRVRQAVSWALASQTGHYSTWEAAGRAPLTEPAFDPDLLDGLHRLIRDADLGWQSFFQSIGVEPLGLWFEDLAADLHADVRRVLSWLGLPATDQLALERLRHQPQATELNAEWEERYRALRPEA